MHIFRITSGLCCSHRCLTIQMWNAFCPKSVSEFHRKRWNTKTAYSIDGGYLQPCYLIFSLVFIAYVDKDIRKETCSGFGRSPLRMIFSRTIVYVLHIRNSFDEQCRIWLIKLSYGYDQFTLPQNCEIAGNIFTIRQLTFIVHKYI